jgi:hypothetical protein
MVKAVSSPCRAVPSRAKPSRAAACWLLHSFAVNTSRQHCQGDDSIVMLLRNWPLLGNCSLNTLFQLLEECLLYGRRRGYITTVPYRTVQDSRSEFAELVTSNERRTEEVGLWGCKVHRYRSVIGRSYA